MFTGQRQDAEFFAKLKADEETEPDWNDYEAQQAAEWAAHEQAVREADPDDDAPMMYIDE